ncbi:response regulator [Domibacillus robiginosus]|uniref:response regulator n=1 Tax=Domibacillus robiginosus TaxID=1071054 RepID=UPI00067D696E|nr:response regulator [Domibacillus robiginosus]
MIRVLLVEDEQRVAALHAKYVESISGFSLSASAGTVEEAISVIESQGIDLILLDIFMPGPHGLSLLTYVREREKEVDVIVISAASDMERVQKAIRYGAVDYLIKPFQFDRFEEALKEYRDKRAFTAQTRQVSQEELDRQLLGRREQDMPKDIPKGLTKATLNQVWGEIEEIEGAFSTEDIVKRVGISGVSARKYLKFLTDIEVLDVRVVYGTVGRPVYQHTRNLSKEYIMKNFL